MSSRESAAALVDGTRPLVSICIPTFNGEPWLAETVASCLAQDFTDLEIVVCDGGSTDGTLSVARSFSDPRVRVVVAESAGMATNWSRSVQASRGAFVKFLMQDDLLEPQCVSRLAEVLLEHPRVGFVFSPRRVTFHGVPDREAARWLERFGSLHAQLGPLSTVNRGRALFDLLGRDGFRRNWIGEPTVVLARRSALEQVGLFNERLRQVTDLEMWLRLAFFHDVGFVPEALATFRVHPHSASAVNQSLGNAWMERIWLLEGLRQHPEIRSAIGRSAAFRPWLYLARSAVSRLVHARSGAGALGDLREYLRFRMRPTPLHARLDPTSGASAAPATPGRAAGTRP